MAPSFTAELSYSYWRFEPAMNDGDPTPDTATLARIEQRPRESTTVDAPMLGLLSEATGSTATAGPFTFLKFDW